MKIQEIFDLNHTLAKDYLFSFTYGYEALSGIKDCIIYLGKSLSKEDYDEVSKNVFIHKDAVVFESAYIGSPAIIGKGTEVRHSAFIRGSALIGENCVIGNSTEIKNAILFDGVQVPHFNYIGDSILGYKSHLGAGAITSNVKSDKTAVKATGLKKYGAMVGDFAEIGCNTVLNPGTVIGRNCIIYPLSSVRGTVNSNHIYKNKNNIAPREEKNG